MKVLKKLGLVLLSLVVLGVILNFIQSPVVLKSSQSISAPQEKIFTILASYEQFPAWSPFLVADPNQENRVAGEDGKVGSKFIWKGVDEESEGFQELVIMEKPSRLVMECTITVPFESNPTFQYDLSQEAGKTIVQQTFSMPSSVLDKIMLNVFGVLEEIQQTNELGLDRLKAYAESKI
ncbi:MAG: SRPBCC family protein [Bacteroidota bacterium]